MYKVIVPSYLKERFPVYIENRKKDLLALKLALKSDDFGAIKAIGHKTKGNASMFGFERLVLIAKNLEKAAKEENIADCEDNVNLFSSAIENFELVDA